MTLAAEPDHGPAERGLAAQPGLPGRAAARRDRSPPEPERQGHRASPSPPALRCPPTTIDGPVVDWTTSRPAPGALVEALLLPDSLPYRGLADSSGRISARPAAGRRLPRPRRAGPEPEPPARRPRGVRQRAARRAARPPPASCGRSCTTRRRARIREVTVARQRPARRSSFTQKLDPAPAARSPTQVTVRVLPDSTPVRVVVAAAQAGGRQPPSPRRARRAAGHHRAGLGGATRPGAARPPAGPA